MVRMVTTPIRKFDIPPGCMPVKIGKEYQIDVKVLMPELVEISRQMWTYFGYAGLLLPWHDSSEVKMWQKVHEDKLKLFFWTMEKMDVDWRSYCILSFAMSDYSNWSRILLLLNNGSHWSWVRKLRRYCGSSERLDSVADFLLKFIYLQIETYGKARVKTSSSIKVDAGETIKSKSGKPTQYFAVYHQLANRLGQLISQGIDVELWLNTKFHRCKGAVDFVYLSTIVNVNAFDPDLADLHSAQVDPWREIRDFLGLSRNCDFPDGVIPKGWRPANEDMRSVSEITRVAKDGYYFYSDGEQRRGRMHHARNKYFLIGCTPENFKFFKSDWDNPAYLTSSPSYEDYLRYGVYPGVWDEHGKSTNGRGPNVRWSK